MKKINLLALIGLALMCSAATCATTNNGPTKAQIRIQHSNMVDQVKAFVQAWRWEQPESMGMALQYQEDRDLLFSKVGRLRIVDFELRNVVVLGDELDKGIVDLWINYSNPASGLVGEKVLRWEWYRVEKSWFIQPIPGVMPF